MRAILEVSLKNLLDNIKTLHTESYKNSFFCPIIKANAYGHGDLKLAQSLYHCGIQKVGVVSFEEALKLKELAQALEIFILGPCNKNEMELLNTYPFVPLISDWNALRFLNKLKKPIQFHLKFNIGMNRLGFHSSEIKKIQAYIKTNSLLGLSGIASHLGAGEELSFYPKSSVTQKQILLFKKIIQSFKRSFPKQLLHTHLLASAAWFSLWSYLRLDASLGFRPGIGLYGIKPELSFSSQAAKKKYQAMQLQPISTLKSFIVKLHYLSKGEFVSYGRQYKTKRKSIIAVVSIGYADGIPYAFSKTGEVLVRGMRARITGSICMDFFMVDVTAIVAKTGTIEIGEEVVIFGKQLGQTISIVEQSKKANSIPKEFFTGLGNRIHRIYK